MTSALPFLNDQGVLVAPLAPNCKIEQLAIFHDSTERISVDKDIWLRLDSLSRATLAQHEVWYHYERQFGERTSESTRSYMRQMLSSNGFTPVNAGVENAVERGFASSELNGSDDSTEFFVHRTKNELGLEDITLQFTAFMGRPILVKTIAQIPNIKLSVTCEDFIECKPNVPAYKMIRVPVITEHRKDWELLLKLVSGEPITLTLIQNGVPSRAVTLRQFTPK